MEFYTQNGQGVVEGYARAQTSLVKTIPGITIIGNLGRFPLSQEALFHVSDVFGSYDLSSLPVPKIARSKPDCVFKYKTKPFQHQEDWFNNTKDEKVYAIFWEMGLGKTKLALDNAAHLYAKDEIDTLIVITLNGVHLNWVHKEIPAHLPDYCNPLCVAWDSTKYTGKVKYFRQALDSLFKHEGLAILTCNVEAFSKETVLTLCQKLATKRRAMCVVDEAHCIKEQSAKRTKNVLKLAPLCKYRRIMTGTPAANSPLDLFTQMAFLDRDILGHKSYYSFRSKYAILQPVREMGGRIKKYRGRVVETVVGYKDVEELTTKIEPWSTRLTKDECLDLPPKVYVQAPFMMSEDQRRLYKELVNDTVAEFKGQRISSPMALTRLIRLHQIVCGFVVTDDDILTYIDPLPSPRLKMLLSIVSQIRGKAIIWATYRKSLQEIVGALKHHYGSGSTVGYSGETPADLRPKVVDRFQNNPDCRFFVGQPKAGGTGITLTAANHVIYYSNDYSLNIRLQSEDRAHRIGQEKSVTYTDIVAANTVDEDILSALKDKFDLASKITGDQLVEWLK